VQILSHVSKSRGSRAIRLYLTVFSNHNIEPVWDKTAHVRNLVSDYIGSAQITAAQERWHNADNTHLGPLKLAAGPAPAGRITAAILTERTKRTG